MSNASRSMAIRTPVLSIPTTQTTRDTHVLGDPETAFSSSTTPAHRFGRASRTSGGGRSSTKTNHHVPIGHPDHPTYYDHRGEAYNNEPLWSSPSKLSWNSHVPFPRSVPEMCEGYGVYAKGGMNLDPDRIMIQDPLNFEEIYRSTGVTTTTETPKQDPVDDSVVLHTEFGDLVQQEDNSLLIRLRVGRILEVANQQPHPLGVYELNQVAETMGATVVQNLEEKGTRHNSEAILEVFRNFTPVYDERHHVKGLSLSYSDTTLSVVDSFRRSHLDFATPDETWTWGYRQRMKMARVELEAYETPEDHRITLMRRGMTISPWIELMTPTAIDKSGHGNLPDIDRIKTHRVVSKPPTQNQGPPCSSSSSGSAYHAMRNLNLYHTRDEQEQFARTDNANLAVVKEDIRMDGTLADMYSSLATRPGRLGELPMTNTITDYLFSLDSDMGESAVLSYHVVKNASVDEFSSSTTVISTAYRTSPFVPWESGYGLHWKSIHPAPLYEHTEEGRSRVGLDELLSVPPISAAKPLQTNSTRRFKVDGGSLVSRNFRRRLKNKVGRSGRGSRGVVSISSQFTSGTMTLAGLAGMRGMGVGGSSFKYARIPASGVINRFNLSKSQQRQLGYALDPAIERLLNKPQGNTPDGITKRLYRGSNGYTDLEEQEAARGIVITDPFMSPSSSSSKNKHSIKRTRDRTRSIAQKQDSQMRQRMSRQSSGYVHSGSVAAENMEGQFSSLGMGRDVLNSSFRASVGPMQFSRKPSLTWPNKSCPTTPVFKSEPDTEGPSTPSFAPERPPDPEDEEDPAPTQPIRHQAKDHRPFVSRPLLTIYKLNPYINCNGMDGPEYNNTKVDHVRHDTPPVKIIQMLQAPPYSLTHSQIHSDEHFPSWTLCAFKSLLEGNYSKSRREYSAPPEQPDKAVWYPLIIPTDRPEVIAAYSTYLTLVNRIEWMNKRLSMTATYSLPLRRQMALWQDTHQMLALFMECTGLFSDVQLLEEADFKFIAEVRSDLASSVKEPEFKKTRDKRAMDRADSSLPPVPDYLAAVEDLFRSFLDMETHEASAALPCYLDIFMPSLRHIMHEGELPDLTHALSHAPMWLSSEGKSSGVVDIDIEIMIDLFRKALPRTQQNRDMYQIFSRRDERYPRIWNCFARMLFCSLGGYYESIGSKTVANFYIRHELYKWFCFMPTNPSSLATWMNGFQCDDLCKEHTYAEVHGPNKHYPLISVPRGAKRLYVMEDYHPESHPRSVYTKSFGVVNPKKLVGNNEEQERAGYCNMTYFCQYVLGEYLVLLISLSPGLKSTLSGLYDYSKVYGDMVSSMDEVRRVFNSLFVQDSHTPTDTVVITKDEKLRPVSKKPAFSSEGTTPPPSHPSLHWGTPPSGYRIEDVHSGYSYIALLARNYVPYLDMTTVRNGVSVMMQPRSRLFQETLMPMGTGWIMWNSKVMILIEAMLFKMRKLAIDHWSRYMQQTFNQRVLQELVRIEVKHERATHGTPMAHAYDRLVEEDRAMSEDDLRLIEEVIGVYLHQVRHRGGAARGKRVSYEWMTWMFGLQFYPLMMLRMIENAYRQEMFSRPTANALASIAKDYPREFTYLKHFFRTLDRQSSVAVYDLPPSVTKSQISAYHESNALVGKGEPLPSHCDEVLYCYGHLELKKPLVDESPDFSYNDGHINVCLDPSGSGKLYCKFDGDGGGSNAQKTTGDNEGQEDAPHEEEDPEEEPDGRTSRATRQIFNQHGTALDLMACVRHDLRSQHMIGKILRLCHDMFLVCSHCTSMTYLSADKFNTPLGFACPKCAIVINSRYSRSIEDYYRFRCAQCSSGFLYRANEVHRYWLLDDTSSTRAPYYRVVYLCATHNRPYVGKYADTMSLSNIQLCLSKLVTPIRIFCDQTDDYEVVFIPERVIQRYSSALTTTAQKLMLRHQNAV